jgi:hypothetical protein
MSWGQRPAGQPVLEPQDSPDHPLAPWFRLWREDRRARRERWVSHAGKRRAPKNRAVITIVHNEPVFLAIWLGYYSRFFDPEDIYVLDNDSTDGSTRRGGFVRIPVEHDSVDHTWMVRTIEGLQHELLGRYDVVLVTDVDEIVTPVPEWGTLAEYLDDFDEEWVNCLGYEILHVHERERPIDLSQPILNQRSYWFANDAYDKAALATMPVTWRPGFHGRADYHFQPDPDLRLVHLHRMDYDICLERHRTRERREWAESDVREGWAAHNRITEGAQFDRWFRKDSNVGGVRIQLEEIRPTWRGLF